jgi:septal ring factor EnvC (AmiA/AmiB activator)
MVSANDDLSLPVERLERDLRRLVDGPAVPARPEDPVNRLTFRGWLRLSGPTFAVMVFGFGLLWQSQQATTAQLQELTRSTSAQFTELNRAVGRLDGAMSGIDARLAGLEARLAGIDTQLARLADAIDRLNDRVDRIEAR